MKCINCGTELPDGSVFCNKCGAKQVITDVSRPANMSEPKPYKKKLINVMNIVRKFFRRLIGSKRNIIITSCIGVVVIASVAILILQLNNPMNQFTNAMNNNDSTQAMEVYNDKIKGNSGEENQIQQMLISNAKKVYNDYKSGKADYPATSKKLNQIKATSLVDNDIDPIISAASSLNDSQGHYKSALEYNKSKGYLKCLIELQKVIKDDSNYNRAQQLINSISATYKNEVLKNIDDYINKKAYQDAINLANDAQTAFPNDNDIETRLNNANALSKKQEEAEEKQQVEKWKNSQEVSVTNISTTTDNLLNDVYLIIKVKNNTNKTVEKYTVTWMGFDSNGYPVATGWLNPAKVKNGDAEENIAPNKTSSSDSGFELTGGTDKTVDAKTFIACVKHVEYYDGSSWDNPYYDYWLNEYQDKQYH